MGDSLGRRLVVFVAETLRRLVELLAKAQRGRFRGHHGQRGL